MPSECRGTNSLVHLIAAALHFTESGRDEQVVTLDMGLLVAGTKYRGEFEERLKKLMEEIKQNDDIILVRRDEVLCTRSVLEGLLCYLRRASLLFPFSSVLAVAGIMGWPWCRPWQQI